jgi:hypothetical protein
MSGDFVSAARAGSIENKKQTRTPRIVLDPENSDYLARCDYIPKCEAQVTGLFRHQNVARGRLGDQLLGILAN